MATVCPPVVGYSRGFQARAADEIDLLPARSVIAEMLSDYAVMREQAWSCRQWISDSDLPTDIRDSGVEA
jgi:hypothetical protein